MGDKILYVILIRKPLGPRKAAGRSSVGSYKDVEMRQLHPVYDPYQKEVKILKDNVIL